MKKSLSVILATVLMTALIPSMAFASGTQLDSRYLLENNDPLDTSNNANESNPAALDGNKRQGSLDSTLLNSVLSQEHTDTSDNSTLYEYSNITKYAVDSDDSFQDAINQIESSLDTEAIVEFSCDCNLSGFSGVSDKKIILKSSEGTTYSLAELGGSLKGDLVLDNVRAFSSNQRVYANGHYFETTDRYAGTLNGNPLAAFYGGSQKVDISGDINVVLRGSFKSSWFYGGSLDANVSGSVYITLDDTDVVIGNYFGGGCAKETGNGCVFGDVTSQIRQGTCGSIFGGGENRYSVQDRQPGMVCGTVNTEIGYKGAPDGVAKPGTAMYTYGGSIHSTVGNVRLTLLDGCDNANGSGDRDFHGCGYRDTVLGTVEVVVDGADLNYDGHIYGGGGDGETMLDDSYGRIEILNQNQEKYALKMTYASDSKNRDGGINVGSSLPLDEHTIETYINGSVSVEFLSGDIAFIVADSDSDGGSTIVGDTDISVKGGRVAQIEGNPTAYNDNDPNTNTRVYCDTATDTPIEIGYLYRIERAQFCDGSNVVIDSGVFEQFGSIQKPFYSVNNVVVSDDSYLTTRDSSTKVMKSVSMDSGNWHALGYVYIYGDMKCVNNSNVYYENYYAIGNENNIVDQPLLTITDSNFVSMQSGYVSKVYGNLVSSNSILSLMAPASVSGLWNAESTILNLPVICEVGNYPDKWIGLNIDGGATGSTKVRTVSLNGWADDQIAKDATTWQAKDVKPEVGDNYITCYAPEGTNTNNPLQSCFVLDNNEALQDSFYLKRIKDADSAYENSYYMWQVAKDDRIVVSPAPVTIYMGGEQGYGGIVDADGQISSTSDFPVPGFFVQLPNELSDTEVTDIEIVETSDQGVTKWKFELYDEQSNTPIYKIVSQDESNDFARVAITNENGETVTSDNFEPGLAVNQKLDMRLFSQDSGELSANVNGVNYEINDEACGELIVRATSDSAVFSHIQQSPDCSGCSNSEPMAVAPNDTTYYINDSDIKVDDDAEIGLLFDDVINSDMGLTDRTALLEERLNEELGEDPDRYCEFKYLDLVDVNNGNVWVSASNDVEIYWPLPEGVDSEVEVFHFKGVHRSLDDVDDAISSCEVESIPVRVENGYAVFDVGSGGFSPFALTWKKSGEFTDGESGSSVDSSTPKKSNSDTGVLPETSDQIDGFVVCALSALVLLSAFIVGGFLRKRKMQK